MVAQYFQLFCYMYDELVIKGIFFFFSWNWNQSQWSSEMASSHAKQTTVFNNNQKNVLTSKKQIDFILHLVVKQKKIWEKN